MTRKLATAVPVGQWVDNVFYSDIFALKQIETERRRVVAMAAAGALASNLPQVDARDS